MLTVSPVQDQERLAVALTLRIAIFCEEQGVPEEAEIDARDVLFSIARARSLGARGWLAEIPVPHLDGHDALDDRRHVAWLADQLAAAQPFSR